MDQVTCVRCGKTREKIQGPVQGGRLGEELKAKICDVCWKEWFEGMMIKYINEYRLNLGDPESRKVLTKAMREFLNLPEEQAPAG